MSNQIKNENISKEGSVSSERPNKLVLQNRRPRPFFGPEDWTGSKPDDDEKRIKEDQAEWDHAYASLTLFEKLQYKMTGHI